LARCGLIEPNTRKRIAFYDELVRLLQSYQLPKLPSATPRQFAEEAAMALERLPGGDAAVSRIPIELVDRFYRVRFGHNDLSPPEIEETNHMLRMLAETLRG
jgi:hypothetical protein